MPKSLFNLLIYYFKKHFKHCFLILKTFCSTLNLWIGEFVFWCHEQVKYILTYFVSACHDVTWDTYEEALQHHKICRKSYEAAQVAQPQPTSSAEPEVKYLVNVSTPEAFSEVVEIDPQVSWYLGVWKT